MRSISTVDDPDRLPHENQDAVFQAPPIHITFISNFSAFNSVL